MKELFLRTAREYIEVGIIILPIWSPNHPGEGNRPGKCPTINAWQETQLTFEQFERYFQKEWAAYGSANLGVVTGRASGLVCVDIDIKDGRGGMRWYYENEHRLGHHLRETSGSGGLHLWYRYPKDRADPIPSPYLAPSVELKADGGHQCVTWPSTHPSGGQYHFDNGLSLMDLEAEADIVPAWILDLVGQAEADRKAVPTGDADFTDDPATVEQVRRIFQDLPPAVMGQNGDRATFRAACLGRDYGLSPKALWPLFLDWNRRCAPPWSEPELRKKMRSAYKYGREPLGGQRADSDFAEPPAPVAAKREEVAETEKELAVKQGYSLKRPERSAALFLSRHAGRLAQRDDTVFSYRPADHRWEMLSESRFYAMVLSDMRAVNPSLVERAKPSNVRAIGDMARLALEGEDFRAELDRWLDQRDGDFIAVENGIVEIRERRLLPHSPEWFSFTKLPFRYDPDAAAPEFIRFLESVWPGDQDIKDCLQLWLGYLLVSATNAQKFAVFIGASRAGKGVLTRVIERIVGRDACAALTMTGLAGEFGLSHLVGKKVAFFHDAYKAQGSLGELATERLISIVGQDSQMVNRKNREIIVTTIPAKVILVCNELPTFVNNRGALSNRMIVFPFLKTFAGQEDVELEKRLGGELAGIFNWALEGARRVSLGERIRQPKCADGTFNDLKRTMDPVLGFIEDCVEFGKYDPWEENDLAAWTVTVETLYEAYKAWCQDNGHHAKAKNKFSMAFGNQCPQDVERKIKRLEGVVARVFTNVKLKVLRAVADFN